MELKERINLIQKNTEEILGTEGEIQALLESGQELNHYIGFEISGKIHLGSGLISMQIAKNMADAGIKPHVFLADWHTWINDKLNGDRKFIREIAVGYFKEGMRSCYKVLGGNPKDLQFILGTELYEKDPEYWANMIEVSKNTTLSRIQRSITIMGREQEGSVDFAKLIYPPMQVADIFQMNIHFAHAGMDQRKAHVIARDVANKLKIKPLKIKNHIIKPVAIHHHLLLGLSKPRIWPLKNPDDIKLMLSQMKMSKSKPDSAVFIHDSENDIRRKIMKAFAPEAEINFNPILDWTKHLIFTRETEILIKREKQHGGDLRIASYAELEKLYAEKKLFPLDLKNFVADYLVKFLQPVRDYFASGEPCKMLKQLENMINCKILT